MTDSAQRRPVLYLVANTHLDTQWKWTVRDTITDYLPATLDRSFELFERIPEFILNFEGAFRYQLLKEYWPEGYRRLQEHARQGRWRAAGCMLDAPDVNIPSPESLVRHMLYGARFFDRELGGHGLDVFLPDCFGFGAALPTLARHCGLLGFATSKLVRWKQPGRIPFDLGRWQGVDGSELIAVLHPEGYGEGLGEDLSHASRWIDRIEQRAGRVRAAFMFVGPRGDRGGGLDEPSAGWVERSLASEGPLDVRLVASDQLFRDLSEDERASLPAHRGELLLPTHGTGCWTSQALVKRWNRRNELLADAAERAAVVADWLGGMTYPRADLEAAWTAFLWHQMHDDLTGTSRQEAYLHTWNDQAASLNRFATILGDAVGAVSRALDTRVAGTPLVVFNPLAVEREDTVEARVAIPGATGSALRVLDPDGREVPSQATANAGGRFDVVFTARLAPLEFAVFEVQATAPRTSSETGLAVDERSISGPLLAAQLDDHGDLIELQGNGVANNLLAGPIGMVLLPDRSKRWPAWEILWRDLQADPRGRFASPVATRVVECGPARVTLEVQRAAGRSRLRQLLRLSSGEAGARLEVDCRIDWRERGRLLKAEFPTSLASPSATYDLGVGAIERGVNRAEAYEVPAQQWADLSSHESGAGLSILNDAKHGWDRPEQATLRLSLLRSPRVGRRFRHQATQDLGRHRTRYALYPHRGGWAEAETVGQAARHNQPPMAFRVEASPGPLGRRFSLFPEVSGAAVQALKKAEDDERIVVRLRETKGSGGELRLGSIADLRSATRVDGLERDVERLPTPEGELRAALGAFELQAFALEPPEPRSSLDPPQAVPLALPLDREAWSWHGSGQAVAFDDRGRSYPGELVPSAIEVGGVHVPLAVDRGGPHCAACGGQVIEWPAGDYDRLLLILSAVGGAAGGGLEVGAERVRLRAPDWMETLGRGVYRRYFRGIQIGRPLQPVLERHPLAWIAGHHHDRRLKDVPYSPAYLFRTIVPVPAGSDSIRLPREPQLRVFAAVAVAHSNFVTEAATELYDNGQ